MYKRVRLPRFRPAELEEITYPWGKDWPSIGAWSDVQKSGCRFSTKSVAIPKR